MAEYPQNVESQQRTDKSSSGSRERSERERSGASKTGRDVEVQELDGPDLDDFMRKDEHCVECDKIRIGKELNWDRNRRQSKSSTTGQESESASLDVNENEINFGGKAEASAEQGLFGKIKGTLGLDAGYTRREKDIDRETDRSVERDRSTDEIEFVVSERDVRPDQDPTYRVCRGHESFDWDRAIEKERRDRMRNHQRLEKMRHQREQRSRETPTVRDRNQSSSGHDRKTSEGLSNEYLPDEYLDVRDDAGQETKDQRCRSNRSDREATQDAPEERDNQSITSQLVSNTDNNSEKEAANEYER